MNALSNGQLHVWWSPSDALPADAVRWLSDDERMRYERFYFDCDRLSYVAAHAMLRLLLERYGSQYAWTRMGVGIHGKPYLPGDIEFNLSHTRGMAACAFSLSPIGVDVESADRAGDWRRLVPQVMSEHERTALQSLSPARQQLQFYQAWTSKEAWSKAIGNGLHTDFRGLDVLRPQPGLFLAAVDTMPGFQGAVCSTTTPSLLQIRQFIWPCDGRHELTR